MQTFLFQIISMGLTRMAITAILRLAWTERRMTIMVESATAVSTVLTAQIP